MGPTWEKPKTSRVYLHAPGANRILMLHPDFKITNLSLRSDGSHTGQDACGVHLLVGQKEPRPLDFHDTVFDTPHDGLPFYTIRNIDPDNHCRIILSAFADNSAQPLTYVRVTVENRDILPAEGCINLLPREVKNADQYLTGIWNTGYASYHPNYKQWLLRRDYRFTAQDTDFACAGYASMRILSSGDFSVQWISGEEQPALFSAYDYFACRYSLAPGQSAVLDFVLCAGFIPSLLPLSYDDAKAMMTVFWQEQLAQIRVFPNTDAPVIRDLYLQGITQCLQMIARYDDMEGMVIRQGDTGRFLWIWEAAHVLCCLTRAGITEYTQTILDTFCGYICMKGEQKGKFEYPYIRWDNAEGALLLAICEYLKHMDVPKLYRHYRPYLLALANYINTRRHSETAGEYAGLYPAVTRAESDFPGYHWVFTDAFLLRAIRSYTEVCDKYKAAEGKKIHRMAEDYAACIQALVGTLYQGHENDDAFLLPHIAGLSFEDNFSHSFSSTGVPFLNLLGVVMTPESRMFEQMERFFRQNGLFDHDLAGRITTADSYESGVYGDCYDLSTAEFCWIYPWMARGEWDKADTMFHAILHYHVTGEYIVSERYCSLDPWYTPWQPNGSGSARLCMLLLDYYEKRPQH